MIEGAGPDRLITFTKVALPYGWLGNMSPYPVSQGDGWYGHNVLGILWMELRDTLRSMS